MPMYTYEDANTGITIDVVRSMSEMDRLPDRREAGALTDEEFEDAEWRRIIVHAPEFAGPKGKGKWGQV